MCTSEFFTREIDPERVPLVSVDRLTRAYRKNATRAVLRITGSLGSQSVHLAVFPSFPSFSPLPLLIDLSLRRKLSVPIDNKEKEIRALRMIMVFRLARSVESSVR